MWRVFVAVIIIIVGVAANADQRCDRMERHMRQLDRQAAVLSAAENLPGKWVSSE
jgi:hypothetical protein